MYQVWPLGQVPKELQRPELDLLRSQGYSWQDPFDVIEIFENKVANFAGSRYAIAVDCCSHGLFLCLKYLQASGPIIIPKHTYVSVPQQIIHAGCTVNFSNEQWNASYQLLPYPVWDAAALWQPGMFKQEFSVISFQIKKRIAIGRGGMILTNDEQANDWLKKARHDGRNLKVQYGHDNVSLGWHYYMTPEDAARGILLFDQLHTQENVPSWQNYLDLSSQGLFQSV